MLSEGGQLNSHASRVYVRAHDGKMLCAHAGVAIVLRLFHCYNSYKNKETITCLLFFAVKYLKETFGEIEDTAPITDSLLLELQAKQKGNSQKRLIKELS